MKKRPIVLLDGDDIDRYRVSFDASHVHFGPGISLKKPYYEEGIGLVLKSASNWSAEAGEVGLVFFDEKTDSHSEVTEFQEGVDLENALIGYAINISTSALVRCEEYAEVAKDMILTVLHLSGKVAIENALDVGVSEADTPVVAVFTVNGTAHTARFNRDQVKKYFNVER